MSTQGWWDEATQGLWFPVNMDRSQDGTEIVLIDAGSAIWRNFRVGGPTPELPLFIIVRRPRSRWKRWLLGKLVEG